VLIAIVLGSGTSGNGSCSQEAFTSLNAAASGWLGCEQQSLRLGLS